MPLLSLLSDFPSCEIWSRNRSKSVQCLIKMLPFRLDDLHFSISLSCYSSADPSPFPYTPKNVSLDFDDAFSAS